MYPFGGLLETLAFAKSLRPEDKIISGFFLLWQTIRPDIHHDTLEDLFSELEDNLFRGGWN